MKCQDCSRQAYKELKKEQIIAHLRGNAEDATDVIGVFPLLADETCRFIVFDFDNHEKNAEKTDFANVDDMWREEVDSLRQICDRNGIDALVERSRSGKGAHLWIFFQKPIEAGLARKFGNALLNEGAETVNLKSFRFYDRMLPMQDHLPKGGVGNQIGYDIYSGASGNKQAANAIFDIDNYIDIYQSDLLTAEKEIIISSPVISGKKVYDIIHLLREKQEAGIRIIIVTRKPDSYGYGDSAYWCELQEQMCQSGFEMNLVEDYCEHFCIVDCQLVWYGSLNFLGKEDAEDNLMRISDAKIANELLEITFGSEKYQGETM